MKFALWFFAALLATPALADSAAPAVPPVSVDRAAYLRWLGEIRSDICPFEQSVFAWHAEQRRTSLPPEVGQDPENLFVSVERPLAATIELEETGDIEAGVTYGLETYAVIDAPVQTVLETILFRWGKPVGGSEGVTYPVDPVYSYREERMNPHWGPSTYRTITKKTGGGIAKDMNDVFSLMVRGDDREGYVLIGAFHSPAARTQTTSGITIIMIKPTPDGRTDYRVHGYHLGQSYSFLGIEFGRRNYGFNQDRIRAGQKEFLDQVRELKRTGRITERRPK